MMTRPSHFLLPIHPGNVEFVKRVGFSLGTVNVAGVGEVTVWDLPSSRETDMSKKPKPTRRKPRPGY